MKKLLFLALLVVYASTIWAQQTTTAVVANGTKTNFCLPIYSLYADSYFRCQTIYPASMLTELTGKEILGVSYYIVNPTSEILEGTFELRMGVVDNGSFPDTWPSSFGEADQFTTFYSGSFDCTDSIVSLTFDSPFYYPGGNVLIEIRKITNDNYANIGFYGAQSEKASMYGFSTVSYEDVEPYNGPINFIPTTGFICTTTCPTPSSVTIEPEQTSAVISWDEVGSATEWLLQLNDGDWVHITSNPYTLTDLSPNTEYTLKLRSLCDIGDTSFHTYATFRTECGIEALPLFDDFDEVWLPMPYPYCWNGHSVLGLNAVIGNGFDEEVNDYLTTPLLDLQGDDLFICFDYYQSSSAYSLAVGIATSQDAIDDAIILDTVHFPPVSFEPLRGIDHRGGAKNEVQLIFNNTSHLQSGCVVFKALNTTILGSQPTVRIDNFYANRVHSCVKPTQLKGVTTDTSITLSWMENGVSTRWLVKIDDGDYISVTDNHYTVTGLTESTDYTVSVRAIQCDGDTSHATTGKFHTLCSSSLLPYSDDFDSYYQYGEDILPDCWSAYGSGSKVNQNNHCIELGGFTRSETMTTQVFSIGGEDLQIIFDARIASSGINEAFAVGVATLPSLVGEAVYFDTIELNDRDSHHYELVFRNTASIQNCCVVFTSINPPLNDSSDTGNFYIDNLFIALPTPSGLSVNTSANVTTIYWTENGNASQWEVQVSDQPDSTNNTKRQTTYLSNATHYTLTDLEPNTEYYVRVRALSNSGSSSEWTKYFSFNTSDSTSTESIANTTDNQSLIHIYPNPASDRLIVSLDGASGIAEMAITDLYGRMLLNQKIESGKENCIDISSIQRGTYMVRIAGNQIAATQKIVIK